MKKLNRIKQIKILVVLSLFAIIGCVQEKKADTSKNEKENIVTSLKTLDKPMNVAIFLFHGNPVLDYAGPYDVFGAGGKKNFNVYTVGATLDPILTGTNLTVIPTYDITNAPKPDIIIIPAGVLKTVKQAERDWIIESSNNADFTLSICNGAFLLSQLGLLDGLEATAYKGSIKWLIEGNPKIKKVHLNKRWVDNGKIITSGGVSAGMDASFYLISKILGVENAKAAANQLDYLSWDPNMDSVIVRDE